MMRLTHLLKLWCQCCTSLVTCKQYEKAVVKFCSINRLLTYKQIKAGFGIRMQCVELSPNHQRIHLYGNLTFPDFLQVSMTFPDISSLPLKTVFHNFSWPHKLCMKACELKNLSSSPTSFSFNVSVSISFKDFSLLNLIFSNIYNYKTVESMQHSETN